MSVGWLLVPLVLIAILMILVRRLRNPGRPGYHRIDALIAMMDEPFRSPCARLLADHGERFRQARGSSHNHQAWPGGYLGHVEEIMNYAILLYGIERRTGRPIPFTLPEALTVLFLHDLEKPWRFEPGENGEWVETTGMRSKAEKAAFRLAMLERYGIVLTPVMENAMKYVEGEHADYSSKHRVSNELAGFCHLCDTWSARVRHDYPKADDPWSGR